MRKIHMRLHTTITATTLRLPLVAMLVGDDQYF
jgi:hypothetical protein